RAGAGRHVGADGLPSRGRPPDLPPWRTALRAGKPSLHARRSAQPGAGAARLARSGVWRAGARRVRACRAARVVRRGGTSARGSPGAMAAHMSLELPGCAIRPGLINAHDPLEFNLFPLLGSSRYRNASEWAREIYHPDRSPVREHLEVPKAARLWWGALKNL